MGRSSSAHIVWLSLVSTALAGVVLPSCGGDDDPGASAGKGGRGGSGGTAGSGGKGGRSDAGGAKNGGTSGRGAGGSNAGGGGTDSGSGGTKAGGGGTDTGSGGTDAGSGGSDPGTGGTDAGNGGTEAGSGGTDPGAGGTQAGAGQGGEGGEAGEGTPGSLEITPEDGGTVTLGGTTVVVPPGAVTTPTTITIQALDPSSVVELAAGFERIGPMVALLPHGQTFLLPVRVTLGHTSGSALTRPVILRLDDEADTTWDAILTSDFDETSVSFSTTTFSGVAPAIGGCGPTLVINAVYSQGGYVTDQPNNDYVELHNRSDASIRMDGAALQVNDGGNPTSWSVVPLAGLLAPGGYYLVGLGRSNLQTGTPLPTPDATGTYNLSPSGGRVAVTTDTTPLTGGAPWIVHSAVVYHSSNWQIEGAAVVGAMSSASVIVRDDAGCAWTGVNADDLGYIEGRTPLNSAATPNVCVCD